MALPMGPLVSRTRGTNSDDKPPRPHGNPPSPHANARTADQRDHNLKLSESDHLARDLSQLQEGIRRARELNSRTEELLGDIVARLNARGYRLAALPSPASREAHDQASTLPFNHPIWDRLARRGIGQVHFARKKNGNVVLSIDGAEHLLTAALADLFAVLLDDERRDAEGLPPFRSYAVLAQAYGVTRRNRATVSAVRVGLNRLQRLLFTTGLVSHRIVEVRHCAARLRIRRPAPERTASRPHQVQG